jgi:glycosyltransferase involved in cell wall biosynthesis
MHEVVVAVRITFLLWNGDIGGAERVSVALAGQLRRMAVETSVLFVCGPGHLIPQLSLERVPHESLELGRGASITVHPARLHRAIRTLRPDVVIAVAVGYLGASVRAAGFRGPIIGVEHGNLLRIADRSPVGRVIGWADRLSGVATYDAEIAISHYMLAAVKRRPHARRVALIPHGVRTDDEPPSMLSIGGREITLGYAGRLFPGKGVDRLMRAIATLGRAEPATKVLLRVAGEGERRAPWEALARDLGMSERVTFLGQVDDIGDHWAHCHVAVTPTDGLVESFGMSVVEAMAAGRPTIVTDRGALAELVVPGGTGCVVPGASDSALAAAVSYYVHDPARVHTEGAAARRRAVANYSLLRSAQRYLALADELLGGPAG